MDADSIGLANELLKKAKLKGVKILLPIDVVAADAFSNDAKTVMVPVDSIPEGYMALDIGSSTTMIFAEEINRAKTVIWNGPMGVAAEFCRRHPRCSRGAGQYQRDDDHRRRRFRSGCQEPGIWR